MTNPKAQLTAHLGAYGYRTREIRTDAELIRIAAEVYEIPEGDPSRASVPALAARISAMSKAQRRKLARRNITGNSIGSQEKRDAITAYNKRRSTELADVHDLLHQVVMAVITTGNSHLLRDLPDVLAYFGSKLPTVAEVIGREPADDEISGEICADDLVYRFTCIRAVPPKPVAEQLTPPDGWL